jgi:hypothetical protein
MVQPIGLTLAGRGEVVVLTSQTVRRAVFRFLEMNQLHAWQMHRFNLPGPRRRAADRTQLDRVFRRRRGDCLADTKVGELTPREIRSIGGEMSRMVLEQDAALATDESQVHQGMTLGGGRFGPRRKNTLYLVRYGMTFEVVPLLRDTLLRGGVRDVVVESYDRHVDVLRYEGCATSMRAGCILLTFRHRLDLRLHGTVPLARFAFRRLFGIRRVFASEGFHLLQSSPVLDGTRPASAASVERGLPSARPESLAWFQSWLDRRFRPLEDWRREFEQAYSTEAWIRKLRDDWTVEDYAPGDCVEHLSSRERFSAAFVRAWFVRLSAYSCFYSRDNFGNLVPDAHVDLVQDADVNRCLRCFTDLDHEQIEKFEGEVASDSVARVTLRILAGAMRRLVLGLSR